MQVSCSLTTSFVRPQDKDTASQFCEDVNNERLSLITPFDVLQKSEFEWGWMAG